MSNVFVVDGKELKEALDRVVLTVPAGELTHYGFVFGKKSVKLVAMDSDRVASVVLTPKRFKGDGEFFFADAATLKTAVTGRDEVTIEFTNDKILFSSGRFKGDLKRSEPGASALADLKLGSTIDTDSSISIDKDFFNSLGEGVKVARLKDPYNDNYIPSATIVYDGKYLTVMGNDEYHLHIYKRKIKSKTAPLKLTIPIGIFSILDRIIKDDAKFFITDERLFIRGKNITVSLPPIDTEVNLEQIENFLSGLKKPIKSFTIGSEFATAFQNIAGYFKKGVSSLTIKTSKNKVQLQYQNDGGSIEDVVSVKNAEGSEITAQIDPVIFEDSYKNIRGCKKIEFSIYPNKQGDPACYKMETDFSDGVLVAYGYFRE